MSPATAARSAGHEPRGGRGRWPGWLAAVVALAVLATGCSGRVAGPAKVPAPTTVAGYYAQRLDWQPCDNGFECARLLVPFDYARPSGRRFSLPVVKLAAGEESHRIGALVVNPGGPGGSGVQYALGARSEFPAAVLARFDIVGFDPRGVAASQPALTCMTGPELDTYLATDDMPANAAQLADRRLAEQAVRRAVRAELGGPAAVRGHPERGPRHGCAPGRAGRVTAHLPRQVIRKLPGHVVRAAVPAPGAGACPGRRGGSGHAVAAGGPHPGGGVPGRAPVVHGVVPDPGQLPARRRLGRRWPGRCRPVGGCSGGEASGPGRSV